MHIDLYTFVTSAQFAKHVGSWEISWWFNNGHPTQPKKGFESKTAMGKNSEKMKTRPSKVQSVRAACSTAGWVSEFGRHVLWNGR